MNWLDDSSACVMRAMLCLAGFPRSVSNAGMKIKIGDKVRSFGGVEGKIVLFSEDLLSAIVRVPGVWLGTGMVSIPLVRLSQIPNYTVHPTRRRV